MLSDDVWPNRLIKPESETQNSLQNRQKLTIPNLENSDLEIMFSAGQIEIIVRVKKNFNFSNSKISDFEMKLTHFETVD